MDGLTAIEAQKRLSQYGPNAIQETRRVPLLEFLFKFWGPIPWMLEVAFILQLILGKKNEAIITATLLLFNAVVGFFQEHRAQTALALLKRKLEIKTRVLRDKTWTLLDAQNIVPGDIIRVRMGDFIPADITLLEGSILVDRSALTGESSPIELKAEEQAFSSSIVKRGEATGEVIATGKRSFFGKTAELTLSAKPESHFEKIVLQIVEYLISIDIVLVLLILIYGSFVNTPLSDILPFSLVLLIASIPIALPATFTLANALASLKLSEKGVLVTKLTAIEEAAAMQVLCCDKTGTLTQNCMVLKDVIPLIQMKESDLLRFAAYASNEASQDPFDMAILSEFQKRERLDLTKRIKFTPFDPLSKSSEAIILEENHPIRIIKGSPRLFDLTADPFTLKGNRVLAIGLGNHDHLQLAGYLIFSDPVRKESKQLIEDLKQMGVAVKMITGDLSATAQSIAAEVGIGQNLCKKEMILSKQFLDCDIFAEVFPQDKYLIIKTLQQAGKVVGMTGDGVNDAPALRQADVGVALSNATDVAKAAASMILIKPGLGNITEAIMSGRKVYRRMLTYTLNKIVKTTHIALFLTLGFLIENLFVITPRLVMFLIFANDFVTMSLASDHVKIAKTPSLLKIHSLALTSFLLALCWLIFSFGVFYAARDLFLFSLPKIQTLMFVMFVFSGLATVYLIRTRDHFWKIRPGKLLIFSTIFDVVIVSFLACSGVMMEPISMGSILLLGLCTLAFMVLLDQIKVVFNNPSPYTK